MEGYRNLIAGDIFIHHYGGRSFAGNKISHKAAMSANRRIFKEKWRTMDEGSSLSNKLAALKTVETAREFYQRQELDKAIHVLMKGVEYSPLAAEIYYCLAEILVDAKLFKDALEALHSMHREAKNEIRSMVLAGYCEDGLDHPDEAGELAARALSHNPKYAPALNLKGTLKYRRGDWQEAENYFERAIKADPGYGEPYANLGVLKLASNEKKAALDLIEKGFVLAPTVTDIASLYHRAITVQCEFARGEERVHEAKSLYPMNKGLAFFLIDLFLLQNKYDDAIQEIDQAIITYGLEDSLLSLGRDVRKQMGPLLYLAHRVRVWVIKRLNLPSAGMARSSLKRV